jgi:hypothetical protein
LLAAGATPLAPWRRLPGALLLATVSLNTSP